MPNTPGILKRLVVDDAKSGNANKQGRTSKGTEWQLMPFLASSLQRRQTPTTRKPDARLVGHNERRIIVAITERCRATVKQRAKQKNDGLDGKKRNEPGRNVSNNFARRRKRNVARRREHAVLRERNVELARNKRPRKPKPELKPKQLNDENDDA